MTHQTSLRTQQFTESVIREMTRLAILHNAVNLAQGFPDFDPPSDMLEAAINAIKGGFNQYAVTWGTQKLRQAIARKFKSYQGVDVDPDTEVTVTCGSTEAMIATLLGVVNPGEEVIIFEPFYENYGPDAILSQAAPRYVQLHPPNKNDGEWRLDSNELEKAFCNRTKAIIINTPNNPTGKVFTLDELSLIAKLCQKWNALAITDEIYEHMLYDGRKHTSIVTLPGMRERTVTINAISKTYSATGWRVGWAIAPAEITTGIRKVHDFLTVGAPHPFQEAAAVALDLSFSYYDRLVNDYAKRRDFLLGALRDAGFHCWKPFGAYYIMTDFSSVSKPEGVRNDRQFAEWLVRDIGVAAVPGSSFYRDASEANRRPLSGTPYRICLQTDRDTVPQALCPDAIEEEAAGRLKSGHKRASNTAPHALYRDGRQGDRQIRFSFGRKMELLVEAKARLSKLKALA